MPGSRHKVERYTPMMKEDEEVRMDTFGAWLHEQRSQRRITRTELAKHIGCSVSALRKIEYGERRPSAQIAELVANYLDVPLEQRSTFVRVARGELSVDRLPLNPKLVATTDFSSPKTNLPLFPTPLIGREREVEQLGQLLSDPQCCLLTLVGPGGIGKTRLAIETALNLENFFADGVYFIPLASVSSTDAVISAIANSIYFTFYGPRNPRVQLLNYLREKQMLLIIDNMEHLLLGESHQETVVELLVEILQRAEQVKLLVTSRECLGLQEEWAFEVEGLPVPESLATERNGQNTSVELFLQRARRAQVGFNAAPQDFSSIIRICQLVEGMPLGIELAASWVRTLSCDEIVKELEHGLGFLSVPARDLPARHQSMHAVFEHSWKLLSEEEQQVLMRLSAFRGGFSRKAAEQVAAATLAVLSALVTKSLVRRSGAGRYDLHELIRHFAAEQLAELPEQQTATLARHGRYYAALLHQTEPRLKSNDQNNALLELNADLDNLRLAWNWAVTRDKLTELRKSVRCIQWFYDLKGWLRESSRLFGLAVDALDNKTSTMTDSEDHLITLSLLLIYQGLASVRSGQVAEGRDFLHRSLGFVRSMSEPEILSDNLAFLGLADYLIGDYSEAHDHLEEALAVSCSIESQWIVAFSLMILGMLAQAIGERPLARMHFHESLERWRSIGSPRNIGSCLVAYSSLISDEGQYEVARKMLYESLAIGRGDEDQWLTATSLLHLSQLEKLSGEANYVKAQAMAEQSIAHFGQVGDVWSLALSLTNLGEVLKAQGKYSESRRYFFEAIRKSAEAQIAPVMFDALFALAHLYSMEGLVEPAFNLLTIILQYSEVSQETVDRAKTLHVQLEAQLMPEQIDGIKMWALNKSLEASVQEILNSPV
jgi:predicted ATPase/transcriptional regulator with XRE-family HTH domain